MNWHSRAVFAALVTAAATVCAAPAAAAGDCSAADGGIGLERIVEFDTSNGPLYGENSRFTREDSFLGPKEVVLTFDDGPMPWITKSILDTLDAFCTKATFFSVGRMALAYPASVKDVLARGHTLGTHTWSHPFNLPRSSIERAKDEIERGFAAVAMAAGQPIAPFFRFPGLADSDPMLAYLQSRGIAAFTVDVISNDSYINDARRLTERTLRETELRNGGIMLFHDIKPSTAKALPAILAGLKERGFKVVHMRAKSPLVPLAEYDSALTPILAKSVKASAGTNNHLVPFYGAIGPEKNRLPDAVVTASSETSEPPVTTLAPPARTRKAATTVSERAAHKSRQKRHSVLADGSDDTQHQPRARNRKQRHAPPSQQPSTFFD